MKERRCSLPGVAGDAVATQPTAVPERLERELEEALRDAAGVLASSTGLMALVSAPVGNGSEIRHVEVLQLHPEVVMVVLITTSGTIAKKLIEFGEPVDMGLVSWSRGFLNDAVRGLDLGSRRLSMRLNDPGLTPAEAFFIDKLSAAFDIGIGTDFYVNGISRLIARLEEDGSSQVRRLAEALERREEIMALLKGALAEQNIYLRIGREISRAAMQECSLVAANYGVANRNLGTIGVLGPTRMDYASVIHNVRSAAWQLSHFVEDIYQ
jgi:heat-inducible transcriptional repressor